MRWKRKRSPPPRRAPSSPGWRLDSPHPVVLRIVLELGQPERLEQRRHVDAEAAAQPLLGPVPAAHRVLLAAPPRLDRAVGRRLLLVGAAQRHPLALLLEHGVQILHGPPLVAQLRAADLAHKRGRLLGVVAPHLVVGRAWRSLQLPGVVLGALARCLVHVPTSCSARQYGARPPRSPRARSGRPGGTTPPRQSGWPRSKR